MIEIVPNWHPIWVHFAIALLITAAGIYLLLGWTSGRAGEGPPAALLVSRWLLWLGVLAALAALLTGFWASNSVQHDDLGHANMLVHRNWAIASAVLFGIVALFEFWRRNRTRASVISALLLLAGSAAIAKTGLEGGENVFEHGLGVQRLPQVTEAGHEHGGHDHGGADNADAPRAPVPQPGAAEHPEESAGEEAAAVHEHEHADTAHDFDSPPVPVADHGDHPAARVASALNQALASGDAEGVRSLMAEDVQIFESGNVEASLEEYSGHHLPADMAFMGAMDSEIIARRVIENGDLATVLTRYRLQGRYKDQDIDTVTTETLVLRRIDDAWRIIHVHWSSG